MATGICVGVGVGAGVAVGAGVGTAVGVGTGVGVGVGVVVGVDAAVGSGGAGVDAGSRIGVAAGAGERVRRRRQQPASPAWEAGKARARLSPPGPGWATPWVPGSAWDWCSPQALGLPAAPGTGPWRKGTICSQAGSFLTSVSPLWLGIFA